MCGRYYIEEEDTAEELQRIIDTLNRRYNGNHPAKTKGEIRPNDIVPVIAKTPARQPGVFAMKWGYTMPDGKPMFYARNETAAIKPLFADGMLQRLFTRYGFLGGSVQMHTVAMNSPPW